MVPGQEHPHDKMSGTRLVVPAERTCFFPLLEISTSVLKPRCITCRLCANGTLMPDFYSEKGLKKPFLTVTYNSLVTTGSINNLHLPGLWFSPK